MNTETELAQTEEDAKGRILRFLQSQRKAMVWTEQLEDLFEGTQVQYAEFAKAVAALESDGILSEVRASGRNGRRPALALRYRTDHRALQAGHRQQLLRKRLLLHPAIRMDGYFALEEAVFAEDWPWIERIDRTLKEQGLPTQAAPAPQRSFEWAGDEKWIEEGGGKALLERIGLWDKALVLPTCDPLMLAVHAAVLASDEEAKHLIVENRTTFHALLPVLPQTAFCTLIYGCGNKIVGNIDQLPLQVPVLAGRRQRFFYFGDIDREGIRIWHDTAARCGAVPALPFYRAMLDKPSARGKTNQRQSEAAETAFVACFADGDRERLRSCLAQGCYYPQEALSGDELQMIWRESGWD